MLRFILLFLSMTTAVFATGIAATWRQLPTLPEMLGVAAPYAGVSGEVLLVAGGANFPNGMPWEAGKKVWLDKIWMLDRPDGTWQEVGRLPRPLAYGISVTTPDGVVCIGGSDAIRHYSDVFRLVWNGEKLDQVPLPPLPIVLSCASGALVGNTLYVACGAEQPGEQAATNRAFALDLDVRNPTWRELPPLPGRARLLATGAAHEGTFYVLGGAAIEPMGDGKVGRVYLREAWSFRPGSGWKALAELPKPSVAAPAPAPVVDGRILLAGGDDGSRVGFTPIQEHPGFPSTILAYDPSLDRWSKAGEVPAPRATVPTAPWRGMVVVPSGEMRPGVRSPEVWAITTP